MSEARVLVVDDDAIVRESLAAFLRREGYEAAGCGDAESALEMLASGEAADPFDLVILDVSLPGRGGVEALRAIRGDHPTTAVIMLTGYATVETAVQALRAGAIDFLTKPLVDDELRVSLRRALTHQRLLAENRRLRSRLESQSGLEHIVGSDPRMVKIFELVEAVAPSRTTVLMTGESGVGKSLIARAIHARSPRRDKPFVELACGSIPETLLESELFGHVKGAFTGAHADKAGRFLAADGGTIFLDEINSASPGMQLKLLRVIQERRFEPVGSTKTLEVDVRVVLASNEPLEALVRAGTFRHDLYYRINVVNIRIPPLRDRPGDVPLLAEKFLERFSRELGRQLTGFSSEAMDLLLRHDYPGNVRELQNIVERAAVLAPQPTIEASDLPPELRDGGLSPLREERDWEPMPLEEAVRRSEREIILRALQAYGWNRQRTAAALHINRTTLYKKMKMHGIDGTEGRLAG